MLEVRIPDLIDRARRGEPLGRQALSAIVLGYNRGEVPDYQTSAWLMAVCCRGLGSSDLADLTDLLASSGRRLDLSSIGGPVADKHSTGGVGDKTSLVVVPLVAAAGVPVAKMSGRGLGFSGGTLDKLEAIPGLTVELSVERFLAQVATERLAIVGQSPDLAPADGKLYALRDVTATVESIPLIASSVMSKKLAAGADVIVLDVKVGSGAFMSTLPLARELADTMVAIGRANGRRTIAYVSDMSQPLGLAVGNALELVEAIAALRGDGPPDLVELATTLAGEALAAAGAAPDPRTGRDLAERARQAGSGLERFAAMVRAQGGDARCVDRPDTLPTAPLRWPLRASEAGYVSQVDARLVARAAQLLGAGRLVKGDAIDPAVGVVLAAKVGARVASGDLLATVHAADQDRLQRAVAALESAYQLSAEPSPPPSLIHFHST